MMGLPPEVREKFFDARDAVRAKLNQFLLDEGVLAVIASDQRAHARAAGRGAGAAATIRNTPWRRLLSC